MRVDHLTGVELQAVPVAGAEDGLERTLPPAQSRRLADLLDAQSQRALTIDEQQEMETLVAEHGGRLHEWSLKRIAAQRGLPVDEVRQQVAGELDEAQAWWEAVNTDPRRRRQLERIARRSGGRGIVSIE